MAAEARFRDALALVPDRVSVLSNLAGTLIRLGKFPEAKDFAAKAVSIDDQAVDGWLNLGICLHEMKRYDEALNSFDEAIKHKPDNAAAFYNRGLTLQELKRFAEALANYDEAVHFKPDNADAYNNRGITLKELGRLDEALLCFDEATKCEPDYAEPFNSRGLTLRELGRLNEALRSYDEAIQRKPDYAGAYNNRGLALLDLKRFDEALASFDQAISLLPSYADAYNNRGVTLQNLKRWNEALVDYGEAIRYKPDHADAYNNRGIALLELERLEEALRDFDIAIQHRPDYAGAFNNRGNALVELERLDEAQASYDHALKLKPDIPFLYGAWLHTKMKLCDWSKAEDEIAELRRRIQRNTKAAFPFPVLALTDSLALQRSAAEIWLNDRYPTKRALPSAVKRTGKKKIRIGYYSADFYNHATAYLMAELFERHDRDRFELLAFSFGPETNDEMRKRIRSALDQFVDVRNRSDQEIALLSRELEVDIAVDLKGFTRRARVGIFSYRAAPLQVHYLGYPGTMGANHIDYLIADSTLIPSDCLQHYAEKIAYLPNSYQVNDRRRSIAPKVFSRQELGLPQSAFVFCCFNNSYKITPSTFDGWMRILKQTDGSVLWLLADNPTACRNLRREAEARGVDAERLVFAERMPLAEHLARHRAAHLFIDTLPYNAHTTASDALWSGLPVLTLLGRSFAGRVAASLLRAIGLPELVATTQEQYETLAIDLATRSERLRQIKQKLDRNRLTTPLFDTGLFTKHIEEAYAMMYERHNAGLPPEHFHVI